jgi:hypothetical protein
MRRSHAICAPPEESTLKRTSAIEAKELSRWFDSGQIARSEQQRDNCKGEFHEGRPQVSFGPPARISARLKLRSAVPDLQYAEASA